jgi:tetratricopeptide (TPR) repeat protein
LGKEHSDTLVSTGDLGQVLSQEGHYAEAERILKKTYDTFQRLFGLDHEDTAQTAYNLAALYAAEGRKAEALVLLASAIDHGLPSHSDLELDSDPMLKSLKGDPAFEVVLADARRHASASQAAK